MISFPQADLPSGGAARGGADLWDIPQAGVVLAADWFAAIPSGIFANAYMQALASGALSTSIDLTGAALSIATATGNMASPPATLVQFKVAAAQGDVTAVLDAAPTQGNLLVASHITRATTATRPGVFAQDILANNATEADQLQICSHIVQLGDGTDWIFGGNVADANAVVLMEFAPPPGKTWAASPLDKANFTPRTAAVTSLSSNVTDVTTVADGVSIAAMGIRETSTAPAWTNWFTQQGIVTGGTSPATIISAWRAENATGAKEATCNWETANIAMGAIAVYKTDVSSAAALAGNAQAQATGNATLNTAINMAGNAADVVVANGQLITQIKLNGAALAQALASAALSSGIQLGANTIANAAASGSLATLIQMITSASAQASATGNLSTGGGAAALSADAIDTAIATGNLSTLINLAGNAQDVVNANAGLTTGISMAGNAQDIATATASLTVSAGLSGAAIAAAIANAGLTTGINMAGNAQDIASGSGNLNSSIQLNGNAQDVANAGGSINTAIQLNGSAQVIASSTGNLTAGNGLNGAAVAVTIANGDLTAHINLNAAAIAQAIVNGGLTTTVSLNAAALAQAVATAGITTHIELSANASANINASADLNGEIPVAMFDEAYAVYAMSRDYAHTARPRMYVEASKKRNYEVRA